LVIGAVELTYPDPSPLIQDVGGAVATLERATAAGRENGVLGPIAILFRLSLAVLAVQVQVQRERVGLGDRGRHYDVSALLLAAEWVQLAALEVEGIAQAQIGDGVLGGESWVDAAPAAQGLRKD